MANRKLIFVNSDCEYEEEQLSVASSSGSGDAGKFITLDPDGKLDASLIPDSVTNDRDWKESVRACTAAALPAVTYANGTLGVGATLTADANGVLPAQDGVTMIAGDRILVDSQAAPLQNGIYTVTSVGAAGAPFVLTRATDADELSEVSGGMAVPVEEGTTCADKYALMTGNGNITIGTDPQPFALQNTTNMTAGDGIDISSNVVSADLVADGGLEFSSGEMQVKFADTSVAADLDGTNGLHAVSAEDLSSNGANQGANILGFDPSNCSSITATDIQGAVDQVCALAEAGASLSYTAGTGGTTVGDLVYISSNDTVLPLPLTGAGSANWGIGLAQSTEAAAASVSISPNDTVLSGVLTALSPTAGDKVYWTGSALTLTKPTGSGSMVWIAGYAKNANDLHVDIRHVKRNAA